jgi:predicted DNA-binding protein (UPF0251 family)
MSDASALASALAKKFRDLAIRFRRIDADTPATANRQLRAAAAWGAKLIKQTVASGIFQLPGELWPKAPTRASDDDTLSWAGLWSVLIQALQLSAPDELLPSNCNAVQWRDSAPGVWTGTTKAADWRIRCENYASAADALADLVMGQGAISIENLNTPAAGGAENLNTPVKRPRRRRRMTDAPPRPLTAKQTEAVQIVGECKGNLAEAARRLGIDRATLKERYEAASEKLGKRAVKHATKSLPTDRRGQENLSRYDDRRG